MGSPTDHRLTSDHFCFIPAENQSDIFGKQPFLHSRSLNVRRSTHLATLISLCLLICTCATTSSLRSDSSDALPIRSQTGLAEELTAILETTEAKQAHWAVFVRSLNSGEVLFDYHGDHLVMPASNMKIVTLAVAAERLGWDYRYETKLMSADPVVNGVLEGDLIVLGSGDPTINTNAGNGMPTFETWATALLSAGITTINGRIIGDDDLIDEATPGYGWSWDDLPYGYATPAGALSHHDNVAILTVWPGNAAGEKALIEIVPPTSGLHIVNRIETAGPDGDAELTLRRLPDDTLEIIGTVPRDSAPVYQAASVQNPTVFFLRSLRQTLETRGVDVLGGAIELDEVTEPVPSNELRVLATHQSPPLSDIAANLMGISQNLYAEMLLHALDQRRQPRTAKSGRNVILEVLESWGINPSRIIVADGSGLSRYNYLTARTLVDILQRMHNDPRHAAPFLATLPVAGFSGTLKNRLVGTAAAGKVHAKTGSMSNVRALSGYVTREGGDRLAFAAIANNFPGPGEPIVSVIDQLIIRLVSSSRSDSRSDGGL